MARIAIDAFFVGAVDGNHPPAAPCRLARRRFIEARWAPVMLLAVFARSLLTGVCTG